MTSTPSSARLALTVQRTYQADRDRVFRALTDPAELQQWFSPEELTTPEATVDLRVGGALRIVMQAPDGSRHIAVGTYREITRPEKLVFTWRWESGMASYKGDSVITVELRPSGSGTEVVLTHEGLPDEESRANHEQGWLSTLKHLESRL